MKTVVINDIKKEENRFVAHLDTNFNVAKMVVKTGGTDGEVISAVIHFAQNKITTDLIWFANAGGRAGSSLEFVPNSCATVSDIYVETDSDNATVEEIELYLAEDVDLSKCYPKIKDFDLEKNYLIDALFVFTPEEGYTEYSLYTSMNGRDFELVSRKTSKESCNPLTGDIYELEGKEARYVRVYTEYYSESSEAGDVDIEFEGVESKNPVQEYPEIDICDFKGSKYDIVIKKEDTCEELKGIVARRIGKEYIDWFLFEPEENEKDFFEISDYENKIKIKGNSGVSIACGLNYYLKYFCKVNISQVGDWVKMPENVISVGNTIKKETKAKVRYAYNYCTLSYSMAFWGEKEWRDELDWLALNGVNLILDATAQEEVWRRFLNKLGYPHNEIKEFIAGPAYYAWAYMANLTGFGGPVHDSWFSERTELARKNHLIMRRLGIKPVLQGYSGMIPVNISEYDKTADVIPQGTWCSFRRPDMLKTTSESFKKYAKLFYECQKEVYGTPGNYYATDPFHEGGITAGMSPYEIAKGVLTEMRNSDEDAVWIVQSWQGNPTSELLRGISETEDGRNHALILDLYAEKNPNYKKGKEGSESFGYDKEFDHTPWLYCMLNNFGGRLGMHGHLDNLAKEIPSVFRECESVAGIGITPEASVNNPVLYDFFFESIWNCNEEINLKNWLSEYVLRRYGKKSDNAEKAWEILAETVYKSKLNNLGQGAPENIVNARPAAVINAASTWGNAVISYDKNELLRAKELLLSDYDELKDSEGYYYDAVTLVLQTLSNEAQEIHERMSEALKNGDRNSFEKESSTFLSLIDKMEKTAGASEYYLLGRWVNQAKDLAKNADDFTKNLYEFNAKALITTWGSYNQSEIGGLHDYSNRQWAGLFSDFYKKRWKKWIDEKKKELNGETVESVPPFEWEWSFARTPKNYTDVANKIDLRNI